MLMKKQLCIILILFFSCGFISCKEESANKKAAIKFRDSVIATAGIYYPPSITSIPPMEYDFNRYFYITYLTSLKNKSKSEYGEIWFYCNGYSFPSKTFIDSSILSLLEYKKSCYQNFILTSIYEFKNKRDYNSFIANYKGEKPKIKKSCHEENPIEFNITPSVIEPDKDPVRILTIPLGDTATLTPVKITTEY